MQYSKQVRSCRTYCTAPPENLLVGSIAIQSSSSGSRSQSHPSRNDACVVEPRDGDRGVECTVGLANGTFVERVRTDVYVYAEVALHQLAQLSRPFGPRPDPSWCPRLTPGPNSGRRAPRAPRAHTSGGTRLACRRSANGCASFPCRCDLRCTAT